MLFSYNTDPEVMARVRFEVGADGRLEVADVQLEAEPRLTGEILRSFPLAQMEAAANGRWRDALLKHIADSGTKVEQAKDNWFTTVGAGHREIVVEAKSLKQHRQRSLRLPIPDVRKRPDSFYSKVAELYSALAADGSRKPASEIAQANDVPVTTVHRWIKEARDRKLLGSGRRGKAG